MKELLYYAIFAIILYFLLSAVFENFYLEQENFDPSLVPVSSIVTLAKVAQKLVNGNGTLTNPGNLQIGAGATTPGNLTVTGNENIIGNSTVGGNMGVTGNLGINGTTTVNGIMNVNGVTNLKSPLNALGFIKGPTSFAYGQPDTKVYSTIGNINFGSTTQTDSTGKVDKVSVFDVIQGSGSSNRLLIGAQADINNNIGTTQIWNNNLLIGGGVYITKPYTQSNTISMSSDGNITATLDVRANRHVYADQNLQVNGNAQIDGKLVVTGNYIQAQKGLIVDGYIPNETSTGAGQTIRNRFRVGNLIYGNNADDYDILYNHDVYKEFLIGSGSGTVQIWGSDLLLGSDNKLCMGKNTCLQKKHFQKLIDLTG
jgi:predicted acyltransferase (DUF342 family)